MKYKSFVKEEGQQTAHMATCMEMKCQCSAHRLCKYKSLFLLIFVDFWNTFIPS